MAPILRQRTYGTLTKKMEMSMGIDPKLFKQMLRAISYPVSKGDLIEMARQNSIDENILRDLEALLPDTTFISSDEVLDLLPKWDG